MAGKVYTGTACDYNGFPAERNIGSLQIIIHYFETSTRKQELVFCVRKENGNTPLMFTLMSYRVLLNRNFFLLLLLLPDKKVVYKTTSKMVQ